MFKHPIEVIVSAIKELENSLKANLRKEHLSKDNVEEMQRTISYLSKRIVEFYETEKAKQ